MLTVDEVVPNSNNGKHKVQVKRYSLHLYSIGQCGLVKKKSLLS